MDQNLTGLVTANVTLFQPGWAFAINALVGPISAAIGAGAVYWTSKRTHRLEREITLRNERHERSKELREERKTAYVKFLKSYHLISFKGLDTDKAYLIPALESLFEIKLLGSPEIIGILDEPKYNYQWPTPEIASELSQKLMPLMRAELQADDASQV
jgi:hypothetical protein